RGIDASVVVTGCGRKTGRLYLQSIAGTEVSQPDDELVECHVLELDADAVRRGRLAPLQGVIKTAFPQRIVDYDNEGLVPVRAARLAGILRGQASLQQPQLGERISPVLDTGLEI